MIKRLALLLVFALLCGCHSSGRLAPVTSGWQQPLSVQGGYTVAPGDTLYSIAWRFGHDYRRLAAINHIKEPYSLEVGQTIYLVGGHKPVATKQHAYSRPRSHKRVPVQVERKATRHVKPRNTPREEAKRLPRYRGHRVYRWNWPAQGKVIKRFGRLNRGIDIAGRKGEPVRATAAGQVVYRGSGLTGYGKLIIIKHNNEYLSAYAHNDVFLVKEGQRVKARQIIARMGRSGTQRVMLHFEIRRAGRPINPLKLLRR